MWGREVRRQQPGTDQYFLEANKVTGGLKVCLVLLEFGDQEAMW